MFVYWLMFFVPASASFFKVRSTRAAVWVGWFATWLTLTVLIGYRYEVGGDWGNYLNIFNQMYLHSLMEAVQRKDPADGVINWLSNYMGWGIYGVNLAYGAIFSLGLIAFCRNQPRPLLAMAVAIPYLVIVVAMGYSRQGVAIGVVFFALLALADRNTLKFAVFVALAALFHKSAVILIPIAILASTKRRVWTAIWVGATAVLMYYLYLEAAADTLITNYILAQYASEGARIRVAMNAVPAFLFLINRKRFHLDKAEQALWTWMALIALAFIPILIISPSSTAVDRVALYFIPIQIYIFSRLPDAIWRGRHRLAVRWLVVLYYALVLFVWLNYSDNARNWLPYRSYLFIDS